MDQYQLLGYASQIITALSVLPYIRGILRGVIVPNRVTWVIWSVVGSVLWFTTWTNPKSAEVTVMFAAILAVNPTIIFVLSIWKGENKPVTVSEKIALAIASIAITFWVIGRDDPGLVPTLLAIVADICALYPTVRFVNKRPDEDRPFAWACFTVGSLLAIAGTEQWSLESLVLPVYMAVGSIFVVWPLARYRILQRAPMGEWI